MKIPSWRYWVKRAFRGAVFRLIRDRHGRPSRGNQDRQVKTTGGPGLAICRRLRVGGERTGFLSIKQAEKRYNWRKYC